VRNFLSNTYNDRWLGRGVTTAGPRHSTPDLNPLNFCLWGHLDTLVYAAPAGNEESLYRGCLSVYSATIRASLNGCGGPWRDVSRCALNLVGDILDIYYKCSLSAINHKLKLSGHTLMWTFILTLVFGTRAQKYVRTFQLHSVYLFSIYICSRNKSL
jgi:hypothetical protein